MIISPHEQGSESWFADRCGIPSASRFSEIFTSQGKPSAQKSGYMNELLSEWMLGRKDDNGYTNAFMEEGTAREEESRQAYAFVNDVTPVECGFCFMNEDRLVGASPDALIGDDGILELKNPRAKTQISYLRNPSKLPTTYYCQVMGQLYITQRAYCDFVSWFPGLPMFQVRVESDPKIMAMVGEHLDKFISEMLEERAKLEALR